MKNEENYNIGVLHVHLSAAVPENSSTGYLLIATSGGGGGKPTAHWGTIVFQPVIALFFIIRCITIMISSFQITDAAVVAWILNAMLVVPELDHHSFWKDDR